MRVALAAIEAELPAPLAAAAEAGHLTDYRLLDATVDNRRYSVIQSRDNIGRATYLGSGHRVPDWRWHVSVAGDRDVPRWRDLVAIGHEVRPGVCFAIGVPPRSWWMSVHPHCLHLWEMRDDALAAQWLSERMGVAPS